MLLFNPRAVIINTSENYPSAVICIKFARAKCRWPRRSEQNNRWSVLASSSSTFSESGVHTKFHNYLPMRQNTWQYSTNEMCVVLPRLTGWKVFFLSKNSATAEQKVITIEWICSWREIQMSSLPLALFCEWVGGLGSVLGPLTTKMKTLAFSSRRKLFTLWYLQKKRNTKQCGGAGNRTQRNTASFAGSGSIRFTSDPDLSKRRLN